MQNDAENVEIQLHVLVTLISMHFYFKKGINRQTNMQTSLDHKSISYSVIFGSTPSIIHLIAILCHIREYQNVFYGRISVGPVNIFVSK